jgi:hypothetical protein
MNPYLAKLRAIEQAEQPAGTDQGRADGKLVGFVGFVGDSSSPISELGADQRGARISKRASAGHRQNRQNPPGHRHFLQALDGRCPDYIESDRWRQAVEDGRCFLATWGERAQALGWTARDLFGLHKPPANPAPMYRRLSRYDETGLVWLLEGREVVALTEETAAIRWPGGSVTIYRRNNNSAFGPRGDCLDDFE